MTDIFQQGEIYVHFSEDETQLTFKWLETKRPSQMQLSEIWLQHMLTGGLLLELGAVVRGQEKGWT